MKHFLLLILVAGLFTPFYAQSLIETLIEIPNREYWPRSLELDAENNIYVLGQENRYNPDRQAYPIYGTAVVGVVVSKLDSATNLFWQQRYPVAYIRFPEGTKTGKDPARELLVEPDGDWYLPYVAGVGLQFCDTTEIKGMDSDFLGMMKGNGDGSLSTDSVHEAMFCERHEICGYFANPNGNGIIVITQEGKGDKQEIRIVALDSMNQRHLIREFESEYKLRNSESVIHDEGILMLGRIGSQLALRKYTVEGDSLYQQIFSNPFSDSVGQYPIQMMMSEDRRIYLLVQKSKGPNLNQYDSAILELDSAGHILKTFVYEDWNIQKIRSMPNGDILALRNGIYGQADDDRLMISLLSDEGEHLAMHGYGADSIYPVDIKVMPNGRFVILGLRFEGWRPGLASAKGILLQDEVAALHTVPHIEEPLDPFEIHLFPNPVQNLLHIQSSTDLQDVRLIDIWGQIIWQSENHLDRDIDIPMQHLASGVYLVEVQTRKGKFQRKIVKQNQ